MLWDADWPGKYWFSPWKNDSSISVISVLTEWDEKQKSEISTHAVL